MLCVFAVDLCLRTRLLQVMARIACKRRLVSTNGRRCVSLAPDGITVCSTDRELPPPLSVRGRHLLRGVDASEGAELLNILAASA